MTRHPFQLTLVLLCASTFAAADIVTMKDGRVVEGKILEDNGTAIKIKLKKGTMSFDHKDIASIEKKATPEEEYKERFAKLDPKSAAGHFELGKWAGGRELEEEAIFHCLAAYRIDPKLDGVAAELTKRDYHLVDGSWLTPDAYYPSIGWLKFEGKWCSPAEHEYRVAVKEVATAAAARDAAKSAVAAVAGKVKKIEARIATESAAMDKIAKLMTKSEADQAATLTRFNAAEAKVKAASDKLTAISQKEAPKEGDPPKAPSPAMQAAEKNLAAARAAAEKESKSHTAAKQVFNEQSVQKREVQVRIAEIEKEKAEAEKEIATLEVGVKSAQVEVNEAAARAEVLKAAWEKSK